MTIDEALQQGTAQVGRREALLLLAYATGFSNTELLLYGERSLSHTSIALYNESLEKRIKHMPLQYIVGYWSFMGLHMKVDPRALIPRPDTEILAELALKHIRERSAVHVLDVCTGSGCIGISLAYYGGVSVTAVDISEEALALARENAEYNGVSEKMCFYKADLLDGLPSKGEVYDIIVSNPPYIITEEIAGLDEEVRRFEPHLALDGGVDGLALYRRLIPQSISCLCPGGALFLEIGPTEGVWSLMENAGFSGMALARDYAGLNRVIYGYCI